MNIREKLRRIKYNRSSSLVKFMIDLDRMVSNSNKGIQQRFRDDFANGSMVLTINGIIGNITMDQYPELLEFIEKYFGIKYTFTI